MCDPFYCRVLNILLTRKPESLQKDRFRSGLTKWKKRVSLMMKERSIPESVEGAVPILRGKRLIGALVLGTVDQLVNDIKVKEKLLRAEKILSPTL
jgi:hypothetical protein